MSLTEGIGQKRVREWGTWGRDARRVRQMVGRVVFVRLVELTPGGRDGRVAAWLSVECGWRLTVELRDRRRRLDEGAPRATRGGQMEGF